MDILEILLYGHIYINHPVQRSLNLMERFVQFNKNSFIFEDFVIEDAVSILFYFCP
jgi:hypothetical protein